MDVRPDFPTGLGLLGGNGLPLHVRHRVGPAAGERPLPRPITILFFQAASGGWGEVVAGQLAPQRSGNPAVLQAASMMVADHTQANRELAPLARPGASRRQPHRTPDVGGLSRRIGRAPVVVEEASLHRIPGFPAGWKWIRTLGPRQLQSSGAANCWPPLRAGSDACMEPIGRRVASASLARTGSSAVWLQPRLDRPAG
jgi:hypothetical protein